MLKLIVGVLSTLVVLQQVVELLHIFERQTGGVYRKNITALK